MEVARVLLARQGWVICDRSRNESYDLLCRRGDQRVYTEVKGTTTCGEQIIITHAEVECEGASTGDALGGCFRN